MTERGRIASSERAVPASPGSTFITIEVQELRRLGFDVSTFAVREARARPARRRIDRGGARANGVPLRRGKCRVGFRVAVGGSHPAAPPPHRHPSRVDDDAPGVKAKGGSRTCSRRAFARVVTRRAIRHIHNHISEASATVAMAAAELSGVGYSLTEHGSGIFFHPIGWGLGAKIAARRRSPRASATSAGVSACCSRRAKRGLRIQIVRACVQPEFRGRAHARARLTARLVRRSPDGGEGRAAG